MPRWTDQWMERVMGGVLRGGVLLSAALVLVGAVLHLSRHAGDRLDLHVFRGEPLALRGVEGIVQGVLAGEGASVVQLGLFVLMLTPLARVAFSVVGFAAERDGTYVLVTLVVLAILCFSFFGVRA